MAVQAHGFTWEKQILVIYGATPEEIKQIKYTSKMDLPAHLNRINKRDISVKTTRTPNSVCMADCLRVYDELDKGFNLVVVQFKQIEDIKQVECIIEIDLSGCRQILFGDISRNEIEVLNSLVKSVPPKRNPTDEEYDKMYKYRNKLQERIQQKFGAIHLDIKCDSKQSRLQCSFNKFQTFLANNPTKIIYPPKNTENNTNEANEPNKFYHGSIIHQIQSPRRNTKPKMNL
jgi:hypothetical protein